MREDVTVESMCCRSQLSKTSCRIKSRSLNKRVQLAPGEEKDSWMDAVTGTGDWKVSNGLRLG